MTPRCHKPRDTEIKSRGLTRQNRTRQDAVLYFFWVINATLPHVLYFTAVTGFYMPIQISGAFKTAPTITTLQLTFKC